jgi:hypothetical protein
LCHGAGAERVKGPGEHRFTLFEMSFIVRKFGEKLEDGKSGCQEENQEAGCAYEQETHRRVAHNGKHGTDAGVGRPERRPTEILRIRS